MESAGFPDAGLVDTVLRRQLRRRHLTAQRLQRHARLELRRIPRPLARHRVRPFHRANRAYPPVRNSGISSLPPKQVWLRRLRQRSGQMRQSATATPNVAQMLRQNGLRGASMRPDCDKSAKRTEECDCWSTLHPGEIRDCQGECHTRAATNATEEARCDQNATSRPF